MSLLAIDLGASKLAAAIFSEDGSLIFKEHLKLGNKTGAGTGKFVAGTVKKFIRLSESQGDKISSIGISVPGISNINEGTVWAPNIPGWTRYPLLAEVNEVTKGIPVMIDSDRACYILGELWQGKAKGCLNAIFLSVGTGIGAGILVNGEILRGSHDIAGAIGWMALSMPFKNKYVECGCFEYHASGEGIAKVTRDFIREENNYAGILSKKKIRSITSEDVFAAFEKDDHLATRVIEQCIEFWGMAVANLVSLFNPEKIIFGGGVFGPAGSLLPAIRKEAVKWAQPVSINQVSLEVSGLGGDAGVYGSAFLALKNLQGFNT
ncbi:MAG: ROK family protein [Bacteroidales bacterium]